MYYEKPVNYEGVECLPSQPLQKIPYSKEDINFKVTIPCENRLDLISYQYYGTTKYWWVIAIASDISNPLTEVTNGKILRIPPISTIFTLKGAD